MALLAGGALWCGVMSSLSGSNQAIPWYITIAIIALSGAQHAICMNMRREPVLLFAPRFREPTSLLETWSMSFLAMAVILSACTAFRSVQTPVAKDRVVQFIDIQLTSSHDFDKRNSPLPGTEEQVLVHRRAGNLIDHQSDALENRNTANNITAAAKIRKSQAATPTHKSSAIEVAKSIPRPSLLPRTQNAAISERPDQTAMVLIQPQQTVQRAPADAHVVATHQKVQTPLFEEVQPPEMVEMTDNDGAPDSQHVFISGGNSVGGTGAANDLSLFLKELHKRIKSRWSPPHGIPHNAELLFRLRADGRLCFIKVIHSSGDNATDEAAAKAIIESANGHKLPVSTKLPFLDIQYKFNYLVDELQEIGH
jgi:hypothetical protein